jgi:hypothetical protein
VTTLNKPVQLAELRAVLADEGGPTDANGDATRSDQGR